MSDDRSEYAWACQAPEWGSPPFFLHENSVRATRRASQEYIGEAWVKDQSQTSMQGWKRAYRVGWRCIRVRVTPAFAKGA